MHFLHFVLGDRVNEGHCEQYYLLAETNYPLEAIKDAFRHTCDNLNIEIMCEPGSSAEEDGNDGTDENGAPLSESSNDWIVLFTDHARIPSAAMARFAKVGMDFSLFTHRVTTDGELECEGADVVRLILQLAAISLPGLSFIIHDYKHFNDLKEEIGYGLFED